MIQNQPKRSYHPDVEGGNNVIADEYTVPSTSNGILRWVKDINERLDHDESSGSNGGELLTSWSEKPQLSLVKSAELDDKEDESKLHKNDKFSCLLISQLVTEILIIIFAVSLLLLAVTIIFNDRIPAILGPSELIPKILFVLCAIVAVCSFAKWIMRKIRKHIANDSAIKINS